MILADFATPAGKLRKASKLLELAWEDTQQQWDDATTAAFEEKFLVELRPKVKDALDATARISELLSRAQHECEG